MLTPSFPIGGAAIALLFSTFALPVAAGSADSLRNDKKPIVMAPLVAPLKTLPKALGATGASPATATDDTFCGNGEVLVIYDEDANGNPVPGTEVYGCVDD
jgi:hypothetical protein